MFLYFCPLICSQVISQEISKSAIQNNLESRCRSSSWKNEILRRGSLCKIHTEKSVNTDIRTEVGYIHYRYICGWYLPYFVELCFSEAAPQLFFVFFKMLQCRFALNRTSGQKKHDLTFLRPEGFVANCSFKTKQDTP